MRWPAWIERLFSPEEEAPVPDRSVHARSSQIEVVRYDRAGKWYIEFVDASKRRKAVSVSEAAHYAENYQAEVFYGLPGGATFDRIMRRRS